MINFQVYSKIITSFNARFMFFETGVQLKISQAVAAWGDFKTVSFYKIYTNYY